MSASCCTFCLLPSVSLGHDCCFSASDRALFRSLRQRILRGEYQENQETIILFPLQHFECFVNGDLPFRCLISWSWSTTERYHCNCNLLCLTALVSQGEWGIMGSKGHYTVIGYPLNMGCGTRLITSWASALHPVPEGPFLGRSISFIWFKLSLLLPPPPPLYPLCWSVFIFFDEFIFSGVLVFDFICKNIAILDIGGRDFQKKEKKIMIKKEKQSGHKISHFN